MISLQKRYERLRKIPKELRMQSVLSHPAHEQASSQLLGRKRTRMKLEPEICIPTLECNMSLPEGVPFVNNMVIEVPEYGMFFTDVFASNITALKNARFYQKLRELIAKHPDQEKLKSKRVKLEALGYKLD
ncbi:hypothetical protein Tco_0360277 [Tanacetum coccineum]